MAKFYDTITPELADFIQEQKVFFVATAAATSRINLSPKGMDTFRVLDGRTVVYLDLTGSGNEAAAHIKADGRMTIMFCSFGEKPMILRLYGRARLVFPRETEWASLHANFTPEIGERQIVVLDVQSVLTSCGFGVPIADAMQPRDTLRRWGQGKGEDGLVEYRRRMNAVSIDGLPSDTVLRDDLVKEAGD